MEISKLSKGNNIQGQISHWEEFKRHLLIVKSTKSVYSVRLHFSNPHPQPIILDEILSAQTILDLSILEVDKRIEALYKEFREL